MFLGFGFGILTLFIPPMPGWYYWIMPFFIYFYVKEDKRMNFSFILLNILYFTYFITSKNSDFPHFFQPVSVYLSSQPNLYSLLVLNGYNADLLVSIIFSLLQATLLVNVISIYHQGVAGYMQHKIKYQPYLIGISGDSGSGKSTLSKLLVEIFGEDNLSVMHGDDLHRWERGNENWKSFTHLNPMANRLHKGLEQICNLKNGENVSRQEYDHNTGHFGVSESVVSKRVVIFEGLHALYLNEVRRNCDLKIFLQPEEQLRYYWKIARDMKDRGHTKEKVVEQLKMRETDSKEYINKQEQFSDITISFFVNKPMGNWENELSSSELSLKIRFNHEINVESLVLALKSVSSITVNHSYDDQNQYLEFSGEITVDSITLLAHYLVPDLDEV
ncbi:MAG: hypothetical protein Q7R95_06285, partial [bacterium]|nr:hypothetical protein [bacterium]